MRVSLLLSLISVAFIQGLPAQSNIRSASSSNANGVMTGTIRISPRGFGPAVTGAPYSGERVTEHVLVAADGTRFSQSSKFEAVYRDFQGRTRTERPLIIAPENGPVVIEIFDPVAGYGYALDMPKKVAHRYSFPSAPRQLATAPEAVGAGGGGATGSAGAAVPAPAGATPRPQVKQEDLGSQVIEGVMATGKRFIQIWPAGAQGSDRPFQSTSETWFSSELKITILTRSVDPRAGETTTKLTNITRSDPDPSLFAPPPDFKIVDETGPFDIQWSGAPKQ